MSHCVNYTLRDIVEDWEHRLPKDRLSHIYLLIDGETRSHVALQLGHRFMS